MNNGQQGSPAGRTSPRRRSLRLITVAGCLAMIYIVGTRNPVFTAFMRELGATDAHFGLLGGIPMIMLSLQFVGAVVTNAVPRRKPLFMVLIITARFLYIPLAVLPAAVPGLRGHAGVMLVLALSAVSGALMNAAGPLWLSWMADLVPRRVLNRYWGARQRWMYATWTAAYLGLAAVVSFSGLAVTTVYPLLATVAAVAGIADILLFLRVHEPPNTLMRGTSVLKALLAPLRSPQFRPFVLYSCAWMACALFAATFLQVYALKILGMPVWQTTLVWCFSGVGMALSSRFWGRLADRHGQRPILTVCIAFKPLIVVSFLLVTPRVACWVLPLVVGIDSVWNSGMSVAANGYVLKAAPQENRSMFIAVIAGLAGICGGLGAMLGGWFLKSTQGFELELAGRAWNHYHLLLLINIPMRMACLLLARRIREPESDHSIHVLHALRGTWPLRFLAFPVGLYRRRSRRAGGGRNHS